MDNQTKRQNKVRESHRLTAANWSRGNSGWGEKINRAKPSPQKEGQKEKKKENKKERKK